MNTNITISEPCSLMQAARILGMNKMRACRWAAKGFIKTSRLPTGRHVVTPEEVMRVKELLSGRQNSS